MGHQSQIASVGLRTATSVAIVLVFGALAVMTYPTRAAPRLPSQGITDRVTWVLGPSAGRLRADAVAVIRLAVQRLDEPRSTATMPDMRAYYRGLIEAEQSLKLATRASAVDGRTLQALALVQYEARVLGRPVERDGTHSLLQLACQRRPRDVAFKLDVAATFLRIGDTDTAFTVAGEAVDANERVAARAVAMFAGYDVDPESIAIALGDSPEVVLALKDAFVNRGRVDDYMSLLERVLPHASLELLDEYGNLGERFRKWLRVRRALERLGSSGRDDIEAARIAVVARAEFAAGEFVAAEGDARRAVGLDPANARLKELLADCLHALGRDNDALAALDAAMSAAVRGVTSPGQRGRLYRKQGDSYERLGRGDLAYEAYRRALELTPEDTIASERIRVMTRGDERHLNGL